MAGHTVGDRTIGWIGLGRMGMELATRLLEAGSERVRAEAAKRNCALVAAPVSGNPRVARAGRLAVVSSGPRDAYEAVHPRAVRDGRHLRR